LLSAFAAHAYTLEYISVKGTQRNLLTYVPASLPKDRPLIISMHGSNQSADYQKDHSMMEEVADTAKFVVVYPNGINKSWDLSGTQDIDFILTIIDTMYNRYQIDKNRVYLSGFSMGGMMTYFAATKIADKIAAFAPISGYLMGGPNTNSSRPVPIIHTHGTADDVCVYSSVQSHINAWVSRNGCVATSQVTQPYPPERPNSAGKLDYYAAGTGGVEVALVSITGKGHWYSDDAVNVMTSVEIWNFCKKYSLYSGQPSVALTSPKTTVFTSLDTVSLAATASDKEGNVVNVKFYDGNTLLFTDDTAPYAFSLNNPTVGNHTLKAVATDNDGKTSESSVTITVNYPPFPALKKATPENESFDLTESANTFTLVYTLPADCSTAKACLQGQGNTYDLTLQQSGFSDTLTFRLPANTTLTDGNYTLTVSGIKSTAGTPALSTNVLKYTYGITQGAYDVLETIYSDPFATYRTNSYVPVGWKITSTEIGTREGNTSTTYTSGPRLYYFATSGLMPEAIYLRTNKAKDTCRLIYGSYANARLRLRTGTHRFQMLAAGWKAANQNCTFLVRNMDGSIVYSKSVSNTNHLNGANSGTTTSYAATNVTSNEFTFEVPTDTTYLLEIQQANQAAADGSFEEVMVGEFLLQRTPPMALVCKGQLNDALINARKALTECDSTLYDGQCKSNLQQLIATYEHASYTAPSAYASASSALATATANLSGHKTKVNYYLSGRNTANQQIETTVGTRFDQLPLYAKLVQFATTYQNVSLENDALLQTAGDSLSCNAELLKNTIAAVPLLTRRLGMAVAVARRLKISVPESQLQDAEAALTDDDNLAASLNASLKSYVEANIAADSLHFRKDKTAYGYTEDDPALTDSLELTCLIKNPGMYTRQIANGLNNKSFPGWNASTCSTGLDGARAAAWNPVVDSYVRGSAITVNYFEQTLVNVPKGVYDIGFRTRTAPLATGVTTTELKDSICIYASVNNASIKAPFAILADNILPAGPNTWIRNLTLNGGTVKIGVRVSPIPGKSYSPTVLWDEPVLYLVGRYSGSYQGITDTQFHGTVKEVRYFTLLGVPLKRPAKGFHLVQTVYEDGHQDIQKVFNRE
jgi:poly(hydroxyalkanoate) depolymerase family esterase